MSDLALFYHDLADIASYAVYLLMIVAVLYLVIRRRQPMAAVTRDIHGLPRGRLACRSRQTGAGQGCRTRRGTVAPLV